MALGKGMNAKLYYDADGVGGSTWTELTIVKDVSLNLEKAEADVTTRASGGWRQTVTTLKEATIEFEMIWDPADAGFEAIRDAWKGGSLIGLAVVDGVIETVGTQGLTADCEIISFNKNEPLEEVATVNVTAKPTYSTTAPAWLEVTV